jgi:methylmalonyl-CoA/ethylmalonyl-CoA epimerase
MQRLHQAAQRAEDLDRAVAFYRDTLGLRLIASFEPPGLVFFDLGDTRLLVERGAPSSLLYLGVDDLEASWADLGAAGVELVDPPHLIFRDADGPFGLPGAEEWVAFFKDSAGNLLGLVERRGSGA